MRKSQHARVGLKVACVVMLSRAETAGTDAACPCTTVLQHTECVPLCLNATHVSLGVCH